MEFFQVLLYRRVLHTARHFSLYVQFFLLFGCCFLHSRYLPARMQVCSFRIVSPLVCWWVGRWVGGCVWLSLPVLSVS